MDTENWFLWLAKSNVAEMMNLMAELSPSATHDSEYCMNCDGHKSLYCTRQKEHTGLHAAHFGGTDLKPAYVGAVWSNNN